MAVDIRAELTRQSVTMLKRKCKKLKISAEGSKFDIINRLLGINDNHNNNARIINAAAAPPQRPNTNEIRQIQHRRRHSLLRRRLRYKKVKNINKVKKAKTEQNNIKSIKKKNKATKITFHFVGIRPPLSSIANCYHFSDINIKSMVIRSKLTKNSRISALKAFIKKIYFTLNSCDINIAIWYSHLLISNNNDAKLKHFGITKYALLTLAISEDKVRAIDNDSNIHHQMFDPYKLKRTTLNEVQQGFDIITQKEM